MCSIPLGSPRTGLKVPYVHVPVVPRTGVLVHRGDGRRAGTGPWTGIRVGGAGVYPPTQLLEEDPRSRQRSGPRKAHRAWSGWSAGSGRTRDGGGTAPGTTLRARSGTLQVPSLSQDPQNAASWPIWAGFDLIFLKLSQNGGVSPESVEKACRSPYFQNGSGKSPLKILRFPFLLAFSHKELLVAF